MAWAFEISVITAGYSGWLHYMEGFFDEKNWWKPKNYYHGPSKSYGRSENMWERIRNSSWIRILGVILIIGGVILLGTGFYLLATNENESLRWSDLLSLGVGMISIGIALISVSISGISMNISTRSDRKLTGLTTADFELFVSDFEDQRFFFIERVKRKQIDRFAVEAFVWKSRVYFDRALALREWVEEANLRRLVNYFKHLVNIVLVQVKEMGLNELVFNRDVNNIIIMYLRLWETGVINLSSTMVRNELIGIFENNIASRRPGERYIPFFRRIKDILSRRDPNKMFEMIGQTRERRR